MKIHKGDQVVVLSGKDKGKRGEVLRAFPKTGQVQIEGVHRVKRSQRTTQNPQACGDHRQGPAGACFDRGLGLRQGAHALPGRLQGR